jgi:hypothetical protein
MRFTAAGRSAAFRAHPEKQANESNVVAATTMSAIAHALFILLSSSGVIHIFWPHYVRPAICGQSAIAVAYDG